MEMIPAGREVGVKPHESQSGWFRKRETILSSHTSEKLEREINRGPPSNT